MLISHASKVTVKILQAMLQQYVNQELPDVQAIVRKGRGTGDQIANIRWIIEKAREFQKKTFTSASLTSLWLCGSQQTVENSSRDVNTRPPYLPPEKPVCRSRRNRTTDWFKIGKGVYQGCILLPCLFNLFAEYIMWSTRLDETQAGIKISRRNTNNLRYADDTVVWEKFQKYFLVHKL